MVVPVQPPLGSEIREEGLGMLLGGNCGSFVRCWHGEPFSVLLLGLEGAEMLLV